METKQAKFNASNFLKSHKKRIIFALIIVAAAILLTVTYTIIMQPERSVANFCKVAKENKNVISKDSSYEQRFETYSKLESVSPDTIRPDISVIKKGYETMFKDPANGLGASFGIFPSETKLSTYIKENCKDY